MNRVSNKTNSTRLAPALLLAAAGLASSASAQDRVWNGGTGNWNGAGNWTPADVPDSVGENAVINAGGSYAVSVNGGFNVGMVTTSNAMGLLNVLNSSRLSVQGGILNNSTITINDTAGPNGTYMQFLANQTISGTGALVLNANPGNLDTAYLYFNGGGEVLTNAAGHTIRGSGNVYVRIDNAGTMNADASGRTLRLHSQPKSNSNLMTATGGGVLLVEGIGITQTGAGRIIANGGTVQFLNAGITSGAVTTTSGATNVTGTCTFDGVAFAGAVDILNGSGMRWSNSAPTVNNGVITVNTTGGANGTLIQCLGNTALNGNGSIVLNANPGSLDTAYLYFNGGGEVLTQANTHTIRGSGRIYVNTVNNGLISADQSGKIIHLTSQPKTNNATMQAINGAFLDLNVGVTQGASGVLRANGGTIRTAGASVTGGSVMATNGGLIELTSSTTDFYGVTLSGPLQIDNGATMRTDATGLVNNATITVNPSGGPNATLLQALASTTIGGTGTIILNAQPANLDTAYLTYNGGGEVLTLGSGQTVRGSGRIFVNTTNNGLISSDLGTRIIHLAQFSKTNNAAMQAINGAFLDITVPVTQGTNGVIRANGGTVRTSGSTITGGSLIAENGGLIEATSSNTDLYGVTLTGPLQVDNNANLRTNATGFTNNGTITINPSGGGNNTFLQALASTTISGTGTIILNAQPGNLDTAYLLYNGGGEVLTLGSGQTVRGVGRVFVNTTNNGVIQADQSGKVLQLVQQPKTNNNLMQATSGGLLDINVAVTQAGAGRIVADSARVRMGGATITNGLVTAQNGGLIELTSGNTDLIGVTLSGPLDVDNSAFLRTNATGFTNNGTITINASAGANNTYLQALASTTISGTGTIRLNANPGNLDTAYLLYNGGGEVLTLPSGQTLTGTGRVYVRTVVQGRLAPGDGFGSAGVIDTRNSLTLAASSTLDIEIGGTNPNQYDRITGIGSLVLQNGTIRITTVNGFTPSVGQSFDIVSGPAVSGQFCGHVFSRGFAVAYLPNGIRVTYGGCVADVDGGSGCGIPDGGVTIDDLLFYLNLFELGDINADVDDGSFTGTVDGGVTIDDLLYYLIRFEDGC